jgi:phosphosulfolactate synthase
VGECGETELGLNYLRRIGVPERAPSTSPFDPGIAPVVLESHLAQSAHLMLSLKISMSCWMIADPVATRRKLAAAAQAGVASVAGGGPYEIAVAQNELEAYLELCADVGFAAIECGAGFTDPGVDPAEVVERARAHGLAVEYELGSKHDGAFDRRVVRELIDEGKRWLEAGVRRLIVEARESAAGIGVFDDTGRLNAGLAEQLVDSLGLETLIFEAPSKPSQFALLDHFGPGIKLGNVPLDELLRVEIYRRGLHADAFSKERLRPRQPAGQAVGREA